MEKTSKKKKTIVVVVSVVLLACLCVGIGVGAASCNPNFYSTEQHIARISERVQERFIDTGQYESYAVYPLYDEHDEVAHYIVELDKEGYLYIQPQESVANKGMYICHDTDEKDTWWRYRNSLSAPSYDDSLSWEWMDSFELDGISVYAEEYVEVDPSGAPIIQTTSHYTAAGVGADEKRYLIDTSVSGGYVPCVKRDGAYLNLVSMELYTLEEMLTSPDIPGVALIFAPKADFNL